MRLQPLNIGIACFLALIPAAQLAHGDSPELVVVQDESADLPAENKASFSASRQVSIQLDLLAAIPDDNFDETVVTVVRPNGRISELAPGPTGTVVVDQLEAGPHGIVATGKQHHGSTLVYLEQKAETDEAATAPDAVAASAVRMTLLQVSPTDLVGLVRNSLNANSAAPLSGLKPSVSAGPSFGFRVLLGDDGKLEGQVFSAMKDNTQVSVAGTRIVIVHQGDAVASTTCDELGNWQVRGIRPGVHGLLATGPAGYAAFAFEAAGEGGFVLQNAVGTQLVMKVDQPGKKLPVVLVPPPMIPDVVDATLSYYRVSAPSSVEPAAATTLDPAATEPIPAFEPPIGALPEVPFTSTASSGYASSSGSSLGAMRGLRTAGVAAAIAIPLAVDDDAPGAVVTRDR